MRADPSSHIHRYRQTERAEQPIYRQPTELRQKRIENSYVDSDDVCHSRKGCDTSANFSKEGRSSNLLRLESHQLRQFPAHTEREHLTCPVPLRVKKYPKAEVVT